MPGGARRYIRRGAGGGAGLSVCGHRGEREGERGAGRAAAPGAGGGGRRELAGLGREGARRRYPPRPSPCTRVGARLREGARGGCSPAGAGAPHPAAGLRGGRRRAAAAVRRHGRGAARGASPQSGRAQGESRPLPPRLPSGRCRHARGCGLRAGPLPREGQRWSARACGCSALLRSFFLPFPSFRLGVFRAAALLGLRRRSGRGKTVLMGWEGRARPAGARLRLFPAGAACGRAARRSAGTRASGSVPHARVRLWEAFPLPGRTTRSSPRSEIPDADIRRGEGRERVLTEALCHTSVSL